MTNENKEFVELLEVLNKKIQESIALSETAAKKMAEMLPKLMAIIK